MFLSPSPPSPPVSDVCVKKLLFLTFTNASAKKQPCDTICASHKSYKKTVVYDPMKSETFRAVQENLYTNDKVQEVAAPVQPRVFMPNRLVPGKKPPVASFPPPDPISRIQTNSLGEPFDHIHQSGSFKRLMYSVLGETDY